MESNEVLKKFREQRAEKEKQMNESKIEAAKEQLNILKNQKDALEATLQDLQFQIDEIKCDKSAKKEEPVKKGPEVSQGLFFKLLTQLETEESELREQIQAQKKRFANLMHEHNVTLQQNAKIEKAVQQEREKAYNEEMSARIQRDKLEDLQGILFTKEEEYRTLCEKADQIEQELVAKTDDIVLNNKFLMETLIQQRNQLLIDLQKKQNEEEAMKKQVKQTERYCEERRAEQEKDMQKAQSVNEWRSQRKLLTTKLVAARKKLSTELKNLEGSKKRELDMQNKFKQLLGKDDPGDGTGTMARRILQTEINRLQNLPESEAAIELQIERDYKETLERELITLENSNKTFEKYRKETLSALNDELEECQNQGYINLLRSEMAETLSKANAKR